MATQVFTANQTLTASQLNTLQSSDFNFTRNLQTGTSYTIQLSDRGKLLEFQNVGTITATIPPYSSVAFDIGDTIEVLNTSTGVVNFAGGSGVTISAADGVTSLEGQWHRATLVNRAQNAWVIMGNTAQYIPDNSITASKIADGTIIAADIADGSVTSAKILDGTIVNADINAAAAIALSKLASGTSGQIIVHSSGGVPTATTVSGDVTIDSTGNVQIAADKIVNADINSSAAIAASKISGTAITAADTGTVTSTMIANGTIVNDDINTAAAIALGKIADATIDIKTGNYTLQLTDKNKFIKMSVTSTANTVTVPTNASVAFPIGSQIHIIQYGSGKTQVIPVSGTVTIYATPGAYLRAQYSSATLLKCDTNIWMLMGDLSAS